MYRSKEMEHTVEQAAKIAQQDVPVMIYGATGTGKELFARLIHDNSNRSQKPFIAVNCAAIPENLIESMMFGTEKGAYTGSEKKKGYIEMAEGGTLFLDELNSLSIDMQPKLLRYLQDKSYWRLGGDREHHSNVRVVAAVNESPALLIKEERLREDLFIVSVWVLSQFQNLKIEKKISHYLLIISSKNTKLLLIITSQALPKVLKACLKPFIGMVMFAC
nr:sigma-54 factor interaction domain-containing protein [Photobacterium kishitanii]